MASFVMITLLLHFYGASEVGLTSSEGADRSALTPPRPARFESASVRLISAHPLIAATSPCDEEPAKIDVFDEVLERCALAARGYPWLEAAFGAARNGGSFLCTLQPSSAGSVEF